MPFEPMPPNPPSGLYDKDESPDITRIISDRHRPKKTRYFLKNGLTHCKHPESMWFLKRARRLLGTTAQEMADFLGMSHGAYASRERGVVALSMTHALKITKLMKTALVLDEMYNDKDKPPGR